MTENAHGWAVAMNAGFRAMGTSQYAEAARHWLSARSALGDASPGDPRKAATATNTGVAHLLLGETTEASAALATAEQCWMTLLGRVQSADVPIAVGSSSFHFRLAAENTEAFQSLQRRRLMRQCEAGLAITRFNRLAADSSPAAGEGVASTLASLLSDILGSYAPEVKLLRASTQPRGEETAPANRPYAEKAVQLETRLREMPDRNRGDDWELIEGAVSCTALLRLGLWGDLTAVRKASAESPLASYTLPSFF